MDETQELLGRREMEKADCSQRMLSSDLGERIQTKKTQPWTGMHIRSAKIASEEVNMSGERNTF